MRQVSQYVTAGSTATDSADHVWTFERQGNGSSGSGVEGRELVDSNVSLSSAGDDEAAAVQNILDQEEIKVKSMLGRGGFGTVYHGAHHNNAYVCMAVARFQACSGWLLGICGNNKVRVARH